MNENEKKTDGNGNSKIRKLLRSYIFDGIVLVVVGILILIFPQQFQDIVFIGLGSLFILIGLIRAIRFFVKKNEEQFARELAGAALVICAGVVVILHRTYLINLLQVFMGVLIAYGALLMLAHAFVIRKTGGPFFVLSIVAGILTAGLAAVIFINPAAFASFQTQLYGIALIVEGLAMIIVLRRIKAGVKKAEPAVAAEEQGNGQE